MSVYLPLANRGIQHNGMVLSCRKAVFCDAYTGLPKHVRVASEFAIFASPVLSACEVLISAGNNRAFLTTRGYTR